MAQKIIPPVSALLEWIYTPLYSAARINDIDILGTCLERGDDPEVVCGSNSSTAIVAAAYYHHKEAMKKLIEYGCDVNAVDGDNASALHYSVFSRDTEACKMLLDAGIDTEIETIKGSLTALKFALSRKTIDKPIVKLLLEFNAQVPEKYVNTKDILQLTEEIINDKKEILQENLSINLEDCIRTRWSEDEKKYLVETSSTRVLFFGEYMAGKSSLAKTILQGMPYTTPKNDRTIIARLHQWIPDKNKRKTFQFVDLGGHKSYKNSGHYFHANAPNNIGILCHDITSKKYMKSFKWIRSVLTRSPECNIVIALTKCDQVENHEHLVARFMNEFEKFLDNEIKTLIGSIAMSSDQEYSQRQKFLTMDHKYQWMKKNISKFTFSTSCTEDTFQRDELKKKILELSDSKENQLYLPDYYHQLYIKLGSIGAKNPNLLHAQTGNESIERSVYDNTASESDDERHEKRTASSTNTTASRNEKDSMSIHGLDSMNYTKLQDILPLFQQILRDYNLSQVDCENHLKTCLDHLSKHGLLIYFKGNPALENIVFNDISTFVNLLQCVFHHDLQNILNQRDNLHTSLVAKYFKNDEKAFDNALTILQTQGILSSSLLTCSLRKLGCDFDAEIIMQLLEQLEVGFTFSPESSPERHIFIPYFTEDKELPENIKEEINDLKICDNESLSIHGIIYGNIPETLWHYLMVKIFKHLHNSANIQIRHLWRNGFYTTLGFGNSKLLLEYNEENEINFWVSGKLNDEHIHTSIWKTVRLLNDAINQLMDEWWSGLVSRKVIRCNHCKMLKKSDNSPLEGEFCLESLLQGLADEYYHCPNDPLVEIPAALLMPIHSDAANKRERIEQAKVFLKKHSAGKYFVAIDIMHPDPVIIQLKALGILSTEQKREVDVYIDQPHKQAEYLMENIFQPGTTETRLTFVEALQNTKYHTNQVLADLINSEFTSEFVFDSDVFMTITEREKINRDFYKMFVQSIEAVHLIDVLIADKTIDEDHHAKLGTKITDRQKLAYLLDNILLRGVYETVERLRNGLCHQHVNAQWLSEFLPKR